MGKTPHGYTKCSRCNYKWKWRGRDTCFMCSAPLEIPTYPWREARGAWADGGWSPSPAYGNGKPRKGRGKGAASDESAHAPQSLDTLLHALEYHVDADSQSALEVFKKVVQPPPKELVETPHAKYQRLMGVERRASQALDMAATSEHKAAVWLSDCRARTAEAAEALAKAKKDVNDALELINRERGTAPAKVAAAPAINLTKLLA